MQRVIKASALMLLLFSSVFLGCFGGEQVATPEPSIEVSHELGGTDTIEVPLGRMVNLSVESSTDWVVHRAPGFFIEDVNGVMRDAANWTFAASHSELRLLILDTELNEMRLNITSSDGSVVWNATLTPVEGGLGMVDGERAFDTIDMLTTDHNNRWCGRASLHEGGANYAASAEAMKQAMLEMGFDHAEVTEYAESDLKNVVGYKWGQVYPDEWIVVGGHFDVAYAFTPPGGGTSEGANDDTSGSTVSLEMAQALAQMEWDHTVVAALWACEEEGLLGSGAFTDNIPEGVTVKAYMNFDMVSLNYPIVPPPGYGPYDLSISIAGASDENHTKMLEWVRQAVEDDLAYNPVQGDNEITWSAAESCASDHCSFFSHGYATFNFFSAGGDASFWQEWHSGTDNLDFMVTKAGGEAGLASGFNTLVWISLNLFIHIDNTGNEFQGRWVNG